MSVAGQKPPTLGAAAFVDPARARRSATRAVIVGALALNALAACDRDPVQPGTAPSPEAARLNLSPDDPGGGGGGGGGDEGGGGTPAPAQYRIVGQVYKIEAGARDGSFSTAKVRGWSRFEHLVGSTWVKVDAAHLSVDCVGGGRSDHDDEGNAGFTDVEFWTNRALVGASVTVQCYHQATFNGATYTTSSSGQIPIT